VVGGPLGQLELERSDAQGAELPPALTALARRAGDRALAAATFQLGGGAPGDAAWVLAAREDDALRVDLRVRIAELGSLARPSSPALPP
ncbi:MAG: hypothetical protein FJ104_06105, partial [Deltaproteobacteria bacterium]|nr:hypothetical protein [Deltaproteobacteria bacterium]